jgi:hypothetical protein
MWRKWRCGCGKVNDRTGVCCGRRHPDETAKMTEATDLIVFRREGKLEPKALRPILDYDLIRRDSRSAVELAKDLEVSPGHIWRIRAKP